MTDQPSDPGRQPAAAGWRWESYGGVEVQVPDDWGHGTTNTPSCLETAEMAQRGGYVGRPGPIPDIACPDPVPALEKRRAYLWFDSDAGNEVNAYDAGWVAQSRVVGDLGLTVFTDDPVLRKRILDSARPVPSKESCPAEHAVTNGPGARPDPGPGGLAALGSAESITLCRYALRDVGRPTLRGSDDRAAAMNPVLSHSELVGEQAQAVVRAILAAPEGEGPNDPENCLPEYAYGSEVLLLRVSDGSRTQEVFVRYSGCDGHGIDDGHTQRRLTADALTPLLSGPHRPTVLQGSVADLIQS